MAENEQILEPVEQEVVPFHEHEIIAVRLADGRICVVLRWVCETLHLNPQGQVQRIERTASTGNELVRVKVQPRIAGSRGGGVQTMPAITLRGFSPWILGINPDEVKSKDSREEERIRELIVAYQEEAKDVLYQHFLNKGRLALPEPRTIVIQYLEEPDVDASHEEFAHYHETMSVWHRVQADYHHQAWRKEIQGRQGMIVEEQQGMGNLLADVHQRLGPEKISNEQQTQIQFYVSQLEKVTKKSHQTIFAALKARFQVPRYNELPASEWPNVLDWLRRQFPNQALPISQQSLFEAGEDTES